MSSSWSRRAARSTISSICAVRSASATSSGPRTARWSCAIPSATARRRLRLRRGGLAARARGALRRGDRARARARRVRRFMVWGDPALYDSTLAIAEEILAGDADAFEYEVVPGICSVQALAARHRIALNRIGQPIQITTGRRLSEGLHDDAGDIVVMLDAGCAFRRFAGPAGRDLLGCVHRHAGRDPDRGTAGRGGGRDRACARRGASAQGLDHGHVPTAEDSTPDSRAACRRAQRRPRHE